MNNNIIECLQKIFHFNSSDNLEKIILEDCAEWDSFNIMQMMEYFESEYQLTLTLEELRNFQTMWDVYYWADSKKGEKVGNRKV